MRINVETPKEPCCEKCGQSLPQPPPLTVTEKITRLKDLVNSMRGKHGTFIRAIVTALLSIADILGELEKRPQQTFTFPPTLPPNAIPYTPPPMPYIQPTFPQPTVGDPLPHQWPTVTCHNSDEKMGRNIGCSGVIDPERGVTPFDAVTTAGQPEDRTNVKPAFVTGMTVLRDLPRRYLDDCTPQTHPLKRTFNDAPAAVSDATGFAGDSFRHD